MAVVKNLMARIGADASGMRKELDRTSKDLKKFSQNTNKSLRDINKKKGPGSINEIGSTLKKTSEKGLGGFSKTLESVSRKASKSMGELGEGLEGLSSTFSRVGEVVGKTGGRFLAIPAVIAAVVAGIGAAAQPAAKFESSLYRLNLALGESTTKYMAWAKSIGLAKSTAADMGATYGLLLSSFISDNGKLEKSTEDLVQATRVIASATGRSFEDTQERIRSGLLGNTEAIEDLGVFVNVAMIESTKAFQQFANGKHWEQLDYHTQQQIRLAAILEQTYARFGNSIQNNVMTQQQALVEKLKDVKLNLSQAFLPIWEKILPALNALADALVFVTDKIARFSYWLTGKDYEEATKGTDKQTKSVDDLGTSYQQAGEKAKGALAAFDEINQLGDNGGSGSGGSGGSGGSSSGSKSGGSSVASKDWNLDLPPLPKLQLKFDPPTPPDAGIGAVATAVTASMNTLVAQSKAKLEELKQAWSETLAYINGQINAYQPSISTGWALIVASIQSLFVPLSDLKVSWHEALDYMQSQINAYQPYLTFGWQLISDPVGALRTALADLKQSWHEALDYMQSQINAYQPYISNGLQLIIDSITAFTTPLEDLKTAWHNALDAMQVDLNAYRPYIEYGISLIVSAIASMVAAIGNASAAFPVGWQAIYNAVKTATSPILSLIQSIEDAYNSLMSMLGQPIQIPSIKMPDLIPDFSSIGDTAKSAWLNSPYVKAMDALSQTDFMKWIGQHPELGAGVGAGGAAAGAAGGLEAGAAGIFSKVQDFFKSLGGIFGGGAIPAMATGGITNGPMLAMVGDNVGGQEVVSPLDDLMDMIQSAVGNAVLMANKMNNSGKQGDIVLQVDGTTLARVMVPYNLKENTRIGNIQVMPG